MPTLVLFLLGSIVGSFLNVVGLRFNSGLSLSGRSSCPHCGHKLSWYELIPIFSFIFLFGRCRECHVRISAQYPLIEILTGLIFATVPAILLVIFCIYIVILIYDSRHKIIPDSLVYAAIALSLVVRATTPSSALDWFTGPILFLFFTLIWAISGGRAMGFADGKLALSIGLLLGAAQGFSSVIIAFWLGGLFGLILIISTHLNPLLTGSKKITMKSEIPFAPFLILGAWLALIFHPDLLHVSLF